MDKEIFDEMGELSDMVNDKIHQLIEKGEFSEILRKIKGIAKELGEDMALSLDFQVNVFDSQKEKSLKILQMGICSSGKKDPYIAYGDSSPARYLVGGEIQKVPHDYCPHCWGEWDFKLQNPKCSNCGYEIGKEVKIVLGSDICPWCEKGKVAMENPECTECGFLVDEKLVYWG